jgi:hypothetical protein
MAPASARAKAVYTLDRSATATDNLTITIFVILTEYFMVRFSQNFFQLLNFFY